jgi:DMSO/TMAO reductase YedYZ molybdopterin-dependent catalytic subunit
MGGLAVSGCGLVSEPHVRSVLDVATSLTYRVQRFLTGADRLAREYSETDISPAFHPNGSTDPQDQEYPKLVRNQFADWYLNVHGLVEREMSLSLGELRALPARTQITRHDCVEGWSCIGKWTGAPLAEMNGAALTVPHGAPLRLRVERQLGYKQAKYIMRIELVRTVTDPHGGRGGYWEDRGYQWYAGI